MLAPGDAPFATCPVCLSELLPSADPVYLCGNRGKNACSHFFCRGCVASLQKNKRRADRKCPCCRAKWVEAKSVKNDKAFWEVVGFEDLDGHKVACSSLRCNLCGETVEAPATMERHQEESCESGLVACVNEGCDVQVARKDAGSHTEDCPKRIVSCSYPLCEFKGPADAHSEHRKSAVEDHLQLFMRRVSELEERMVSETSKLEERMAVKFEERISLLEDSLLSRHRDEVDLLKMKLEASCCTVVRIPIGYKGSLCAHLPPSLLPDDCEGRSFVFNGGNGLAYVSLPFLANGLTWELRAEFNGTRILDPNERFLEKHGDTTFLGVRCWIYVHNSLKMTEDDAGIKSSKNLDDEPEWTDAPF
ncbi:hypothetical protein DFJ74DRAFT_706690 [Hyaloraphidium curvatum]|nr:hypothetical protein DFJ74DRAFT_706690 [Hyaloraphidium curvatum]